MGDSLPPSSVRPSSPRPALPNQLSGWAALAEQAGFQNWEQVFSGFVQDSPSGAQELFNFLQKKSKEMAEKKEENSASVKEPHADGDAGQSQRAHARDSSESHAQAGSETAKQRRINIGGTSAKEGWMIFNALKLPCVDVVGLSSDLSHWECNSVVEVYSSHCFEHLGYQKELMVSLKEVLRVLVPGGTFKCSVPNLEVLSELYLRAPPQDQAFSRFAIMRMIYGGQMDDFDFHKVGFDFGTLRLFMLEAGFESVVQVPGFDLFQDTSSLVWNGTPISLNVVAQKARART